MESHDETGCQAPDCPMPCVNNCGFFGRAATMNMCSKCYKDTILKQEHAKFAASSIGSIINGNGKEPVVAGLVDVQMKQVVEAQVENKLSNDISSSKMFEAVGVKQVPKKCTTCRKRVGLTGFNCKCGNLFCSAHRYSDKHDCPFDYHSAAQDAIAKSNPVVKAEKLDKV